MFRQTDDNQQPIYAPIYAPNRQTYDQSKKNLEPLSSTYCPFCEKFKKDPDELAEDNLDKHFIVQEFDYGTVLALNQKPYTAGHCMVIPKEHIEDWTKLSDQQMKEWIQVRSWTIKIIQKLYSEHFNTFVNGGKIGGQSVLHIHEQILPRTLEGAISFMSGVHVLTETLAITRKKLKKPLNILWQQLHDGRKNDAISLFDDNAS